MNWCLGGGGGLTYLDISFGGVASLASVAAFPRLDTLVADSNKLNDLSTLPALPALETLQLNNNFIDALNPALEIIAAKAPTVAFLSLLGNPCCPDDVRLML